MHFIMSFSSKFIISITYWRYLSIMILRKIYNREKIKLFLKLKFVVGCPVSFVLASYVIVHTIFSTV